MELPHLLRRRALEADGAAVGKGRRLIVDRLTDGKAVALVPVEEADVPGGGRVGHSRGRPERGEHGVVKAPGSLDIVGPDHDVIEHAFPLVTA